MAYVEVLNFEKHFNWEVKVGDSTRSDLVSYILDNTVVWNRE